MSTHSQDNQDLDRRLQELEEEVMQTTRMRSPEQPTATPNSILTEISEWYRELSTGGKVVVAVIGLLVTSSLLSIALQLVAVAVRLAVLGAIVYLVYRLLFRRPKTKI
ncbi:MAG TPA: hypothetical protein IGS37_18080 [Synechococcales cyanobacterium M55_K2018_004]|nr:hypothetical protein [Synechococcales cyanobacterium M55_K2018_004]